MIWIFPWKFVEWSHSCWAHTPLKQLGWLLLLLGRSSALKAVVLPYFSALKNCTGWANQSRLACALQCPLWGKKRVLLCLQPPSLSLSETPTGELAGQLWEPTPRSAAQSCCLSAVCNHVFVDTISQVNYLHTNSSLIVSIGERFNWWPFLTSDRIGTCAVLILLLNSPWDSISPLISLCYP